jgi:hypothetical protein
VLTMTHVEYHDPAVAGVSDLPRKPQPCNFFPPHIRDALVAASQVSVFYDPLARQKAIDRAVAKARAAFPELFHKEF